MPLFSPTSADLETLNHQLEGCSASDILRWAGETWPAQLALTCSFGGASGMVLLDLAMRAALELDVLVLDTGLLFAETYTLIDQIEPHYGVRVRRIQPALSLEQQDAQFGRALYGRDPDQCCAMRKVAPLRAALQPYGAWITAVRRDQSATRGATPVVSWNARHALVKICPLATWSERDVWRYVHHHGVPYNPLLDQGYPSLGCHTCTGHPTDADPRSGRWAGFAKTECGLHT